MAIFKQINSSGSKGTNFSTGNLQEYLEQEEKIELKTTINCQDNWARDFERTREVLGSGNTGRIHSHYVLSFSDKDDISPSEAHRFAEELVSRLDKLKECEVAIISHKDETHAHCHIVVNQTKLDGSKLHINRSEMLEIKREMQALTLELNKNRVLENKKELENTRIQKKSFDEKKLERTARREKINNISEKLEEILENSYSLEGFKEQCRDNSIEVEETYKQIKFRFEGERRWVQQKMLDDKFHKENLKELLSEKDLYQDLKNKIEFRERDLEEYSYLYDNYERREKQEKLKEYKQELLEQARKQDYEVYERLKKDFSIEKDRDLEL